MPRPAPEGAGTGADVIMIKVSTYELLMLDP